MGRALPCSWLLGLTWCCALPVLPQTNPSVQHTPSWDPGRLAVETYTWFWSSLKHPCPYQSNLVGGQVPCDSQNCCPPWSGQAEQLQGKQRPDRKCPPRKLKEGHPRTTQTSNPTTKGKNYMKASRYVEKLFNKNQHNLMARKPQWADTKGVHLNTTKTSTLGRKLVLSGTRQGSAFAPFLLIYSHKSTPEQSSGKNKKWHHIAKVLLVDNIIQYVESSKDSTEKLWEPETT